MPRPRALRFLFLNEPGGDFGVPIRPEGTFVPRIIHQTYRDAASLPPEIRASIDDLRARNPGWEYRFHDDAAVARFIRDAYGEAVFRQFERIDRRYGAARADLFRYLLMYHTGGVYLDIKSTVTRPLDEIVRPDDRLILTQWPREGRFEGAGRHDWEFAGKIEGGEFQQWHLICAPGHPGLRAVIQAVLRNITCYVPSMHGTGRNAVLRVTGPIAYTLALLPVLARVSHRRVENHEILGLDYSVYDGNADHKRLFATHYTELTAPIVRPTLFRRGLSALSPLFDRARA
jgi:mannosyltransferase OCH1-like enzyme